MGVGELEVVLVLRAPHRSSDQLDRDDRGDPADHDPPPSRDCELIGAVWGILNFLSFLCLVATLVYLTDVRPSVREISGGSRW
jgi:hypothetical protein